jgi:hypothetical protein
MKYEITDFEANVIKDILQAVGRDDELNYDIAAGLGMSEDEFNKIADKIFNKLQNGRLTVKFS